MHKFVFQISKIALLTVLLIITSCDPGADPPMVGEVKLNFTVQFDGEIYRMGVDRPEYFGHRLQFEKFKFYISQIALMKENNQDKTKLFSENENILLIDLSELDTENEAMIGKYFTDNKIPEGVYSQIIFGIGVPPDFNFNAFPLGEYHQPHPLAYEDMYDTELKSYRFMTLEGLTDIENDGNMNDIFRYRPGGNTLYQNPRNYVLSAPITVSKNTAARINITIDLKDILLGQNPPRIEPSMQYETNSTNMHTLGSRLMRNLKEAVDVK